MWTNGDGYESHIQKITQSICYFGDHFPPPLGPSLPSSSLLVVLHRLLLLFSMYDRLPCGQVALSLFLTVVVISYARHQEKKEKPGRGNRLVGHDRLNST